MSWVRVWIHLVFSTKNWEPFLSKDIRLAVFEHILQNANRKDLWIDCVNGYTDHAHCLISLSRELSISKTAQLIKGESSFWINKNNLTPNKFAWQDDYWAVSVGEKDLDRLRFYISRQEEHHKKISFKEELKQFCIENGLEK